MGPASLVYFKRMKAGPRSRSNRTHLRRLVCQLYVDQRWGRTAERPKSLAPQTPLTRNSEFANNINHRDLRRRDPHIPLCGRQTLEGQRSDSLLLF